MISTGQDEVYHQGREGVGDILLADYRWCDPRWWSTPLGDMSHTLASARNKFITPNKWLLRTRGGLQEREKPQQRQPNDVTADFPPYFTRLKCIHCMKLMKSSRKIISEGD